MRAYNSSVAAIRAILTLCWLVGASTLGMVRAADQGKSTKPIEKTADGQHQAEKDFAAVFAAIEPTDMAIKRWVVVDTGPEGSQQKVEGWLLEDEKQQIRLVDDNGDYHRMRKPRPDERRPRDIAAEQALADDSPFPVAWDVRPGDFVARCKQVIEHMLHGETKFQAMNYKAEGILIVALRQAHWATQVGEKAVAAQLYATVLHQSEKAPLTAKALAEALAYRYHERAILDATGAIRADSLRTWESIARLPDSNYRDEAGQVTQYYKSLIAEDAVWKEPDAQALSQLSAEETTKYWIYHLRDIRASEMSMPGFCSVFGQPWSMVLNEPNPAAKLASQEMKAIPEIIAHLDDSRPTRSVAVANRFSPDALYVLRYGDCCQQIFEKITGHTIYQYQYPIRDGKGKECKAEAERWWAEFQRKGEKRMLIEGVEAGTADSLKLAEKLLKKYPDAALEAMTIAVSRCENECVLKGLIEAVSDCHDERVLPFLLKELHDSRRTARVAAALALAKKRHDEGVKIAIDEWRDIQRDQESRSEDVSGREDWVEFLSRCGKPEAIRALAVGFRRSTDSTRQYMVECCGNLRVALNGDTLSQEVQSFVDELLIGALDDTTIIFMEQGGGDGQGLWHPLIGDLAAEALAKRWAKPELFTIAAPLWIRERQRSEIRNAWLKKLGKPAPQIPPPRSATPATDNEVVPLVHAVRKATTADERQAAVKKIATIGLPAMRLVGKSLKTMKSGEQGFSELQDLAQMLSLKVEDVRFTADSVAPSDAFRNLVESFRGKSVSNKTFEGLLLAAMKGVPAGARGFRMTLERIGDDSGATLRVTLLACRPPPKDARPGTRNSVEVVVGKHPIQGSMTLFPDEVRLDSPGEWFWHYLAGSSETALSSKPDEYFMIRVQCEDERRR